MKFKLCNVNQIVEGNIIMFDDEPAIAYYDADHDKNWEIELLNERSSNGPIVRVVEDGTESKYKFPNGEIVVGQMAHHNNHLVFIYFNKILDVWCTYILYPTNDCKVLPL